jgi:hypothetical protein
LCYTCGRKGHNRHFKEEEVKVLEITINAKQVIAAVWTMIAIVISLIFGLGWLLDKNPLPWYILMALLFGVFLVVALPVYLLLALWAIATRPESE